MVDVDALFDEFALRRQRGDRPDPAEYLDRAGGRADELRDLIEGFLLAAPSPPPHADDIAVVRALMADQPPLVALRAAHGRRRADVVAHLLTALGLPARVRERLHDRYHELEAGLLAPAGIDRRVVAAVADALGVAPRDVPLWRAPPPTLITDAVMTRATPAPPGAMASPAPPAAEAVADEAVAEVDRLFGVA